MRRAGWFVTGAAAGVSGALYAKRKVARVADTVRPSNLAGSATDAMRRTGRRIGDAVREGVVAARRHERELQAERDGRLVRLGDYLGDGDEVVVAGEPVDSANVVVLRRPES